MELKAVIDKWEKELELHARVIKEPLMYTKEELIKSASKAITIYTILLDLKKINSID